MCLITGTVDKYRDVQVFDHFLNLRCMQDHGGLDGDITVLVDQHLIIRFAVFSGELDLAVFHCLFCFLNVPAGRIDSAHLDIVDSVQGTEQCHRGTCCQIDSVQRFLQYDDTLIQTFRCFGSFRYQQILCTVVYIDQLIVVIVIVDIVTLRIVQFQFSLAGQTGNFRGIRCVRQI